MPTTCDTVIHQLLNRPLSNHAWNADKSKVAVCPNSEEIIVFKMEGSKWVVEDVLKEHDQLVTGLDWCSATNKIISCSMDRNAYVWITDGKGKWKPTLVTLRISKAATCVSWNEKGTKFAVGSSNGSLVVGYFENENDWWLCKHLKVNLENTISSIAWHPNGIDLIAGSIDGNVLITSGHIKSIDEDDSIYSNFKEFTSSPIVDVTFSPSGSRIAYLNYDAKITIVNFGNNSKDVVSLGELPMLQVRFIFENLIVATGHSYSPTVIGVDKSSEKWYKIDDLNASNGKKKEKSSVFGNAFAKFKNMDDCGLGSNESKSLDLSKTGHQNTITKLNLLKSENSKVSKISTSSFDGNLIVWDIQNLLNTQKFSNLSIV